MIYLKILYKRVKLKIGRQTLMQVMAFKYSKSVNRVCRSYASYLEIAREDIMSGFALLNLATPCVALFSVSLFPYCF